MSCSELAPVRSSGNAADKEAEDARRFILQVKRTVERCVAQGMNKEQMFRAIREGGLNPGAAFAVYKELRRQNRGFFREYYCTIDLKEQRKRLDRLILAYRTGGRSNAVEDEVRVPPETVTKLIATEETDVPVNMLEWPDQQSMQAQPIVDGRHPLANAAWPVQAAHLSPGEQAPNHGEQRVANAVVAWPYHEQLLNHEQHAANGASFQEPAWPSQAFLLPAAQNLHNHAETAANGGFPGLVWPQQKLQVQAGQQLLHNHHQHVHLPTGNSGFEGLAWPLQAVQLPAAQLRYHEQPVANVLPALTSSARFLNDDAMMDHPWPLSHGGLSLWQGQQDEPMREWWAGASDNPSSSSSLSELPENPNYKGNVSFHEHLQ